MTATFREPADGRQHVGGASGAVPSSDPEVAGGRNSGSEPDLSASAGEDESEPVLTVQSQGQRSRGNPTGYAPLDNDADSGERGSAEENSSGAVFGTSKALEHHIGRRHTTDCCCGLLFGLFWLHILSITGSSLQRGDPRRLFHGFDYHGRLCGVDDEVRKELFVYWPKPEEFAYPICVSDCPTDSSLKVVFPREWVSSQRPNNFTVVTQITFDEEFVSTYPTERIGGLFCLPVASTGLANETASPPTSAHSSAPPAAPNTTGVAVPPGTSEPTTVPATRPAPVQVSADHGANVEAGAATGAETLANHTTPASGGAPPAKSTAASALHPTAGGNSTPAIGKSTAHDSGGDATSDGNVEANHTEERDGSGMTGSGEHEENVQNQNSNQKEKGRGVDDARKRARKEHHHEDKAQIKSADNHKNTTKARASEGEKEDKQEEIRNGGGDDEQTKGAKESARKDRDAMGEQQVDEKENSATKTQGSPKSLRRGHNDANDEHKQAESKKPADEIHPKDDGHTAKEVAGEQSHENHNEGDDKTRIPSMASRSEHEEAHHSAKEENHTASQSPSMKSDSPAEKQGNDNVDKMSVTDKNQSSDEASVATSAADEAKSVQTARKTHPRTDLASTTTDAHSSHPKVNDGENDHVEKRSLQALQQTPSPRAAQLAELREQVGTPVERIRNSFKDVANAWLLLFSILPFSVGVGYAYMYLLKSCARALTWAVLGSLICFTLFASCYFLFMVDDDESRAMFGAYTHKPRTAVQVVGAATSAATLILLVLLCYLHQSVERALACIETSCDALWSLPQMLLMPVCEISVKVFLVIVWLMLFAWVLSSGEIKAPTAEIHGIGVHGLVFRFEYTLAEKWNIALYVVALLWGLETVTIIFQFLMGYAVVVWYFTPCKTDLTKPQVPKTVWESGLRCAARYHMGSLSLAGAIIGVFRLLHTVLQSISKQAKRKPENHVSEIIGRVCMCSVWLFEEIVRYMNKNAIIELVLNSTDFFTSAGAAIRRIEEADAEVAALNGITSVFQSIGTVGITGLGAWVASIAVTHCSLYSSSDSVWFVETPAAVVGVAGLISFMVATAFMFMFDMTSDTLLFCWLCDTEDEGVDFAPRGLQAILGNPKRDGVSNMAAE